MAESKYVPSTQGNPDFRTPGTPRLNKPTEPTDQAHPQNESLFQRAKRWAKERRLFSKAKKGVAVAAIVGSGGGIAHHVANVDIPGPIPVGAAVDQGAQVAVDKITTVLNSASTQNAENQVTNQEQKMNQEYVYRNGVFAIDAKFVNGTDIAKIGDTTVSDKFNSYDVSDGELVKTEDGWQLVFLVTTADGKAMPKRFACFPSDTVGDGPQDGAIVKTPGKIVAMGTEEASGLALADLSKTAGDTEPVPTIQNIPTAPN